jgi:hypothetical protein
VHIFIGLVALGMAAPAEIPLLLPIAFATAFHPVVGPTIQLQMRLVTYAVISIPFALLYRYHPVDTGSEFGQLVNLAFYAGLFGLTLVVIKLYSVPDVKRLPRALALSGLTVAGMGTELGHEVYLVLLVVYGAATLVLVRAQLAPRLSRRRGTRLLHAGAFGVCCVAAVGLSIYLAGLMEQREDEIRRFLFRYPQRRRGIGASIGFSDSSSLETITRHYRDSREDDRVALRAWGGTSPGYLRGRVYLRYIQGEWLAEGLGGGEAREVNPQEDPDYPEGLRRLILPGRRDPGLYAEPALTVLPRKRFGGHVFLPLSAAAVDIGTRVLLLQPGNAVRSPRRSTHLGYGVHLAEPPFFDAPEGERGLSRAERAAGVPAGGYTRDPLHAGLRRALDGALRKAGLHRGPVAADDAVERLLVHFHRRYEYELGVELAEGTDPLVQFLDLENGPRAGHCEFFASAGTLLLRRLDIPARYVTGFVMRERNPWGDLWLARNRDAHAWVEYRDPEAGWRIADFTPPSGQPGTGGAGGGGFLEYVQAQWERISALIDRRGLLTLLLEGMAYAGGWLIETWWRVTLLVLALAGVFLRRFWRGWGRRRVDVVSRRAFTGELADLRRNYFRLQWRLRWRGLGKDPDETLAEYAERLEEEPPFPAREEAVRVVRTLDALRYRPGPPGPAGA